VDIEQLGEDILVIAASIPAALDFLNGEIAEAAVSHINRQKIPKDRHYAILKPVQQWHLTNPRSALPRIPNALERAIILLGVHEPKASGECDLTDHV
jgi:hypothetical protein